MQGWRNTQEDAHVAEQKLFGSDIQVFGVFDGHGGHQVAKWVEANFAKLLNDIPSFKNGDYKKALEELFLKIDELLLTPQVNKELQSYTGEEPSGPSQWGQTGDKLAYSIGCTANVALITPTEIYVANAGDSRCVAANKLKVAIELSKDHKPDNPEEKKRIEEADGFVEDN